MFQETMLSGYEWFVPSLFVAVDFLDSVFERMVRVRAIMVR